MPSVDAGSEGGQLRALPPAAGKADQCDCGHRRRSGRSPEPSREVPSAASHRFIVSPASSSQTGRPVCQPSRSSPTHPMRRKRTSPARRPSERSRVIRSAATTHGGRSLLLQCRRRGTLSRREQTAGSARGAGLCSARTACSSRPGSSTAGPRPSSCAATVPAGRRLVERPKGALNRVAW